MSGLPEGTVTVWFSDVEGSTALHTAFGDVAAQRVLASVADIVRAHVVDHGGHEVKNLGDGAMAVFTSSRRAVECAVATQRALARRAPRGLEGPVQVRIGLHTGEVVVREDDLYGAAVHAAARICAAAAGGQVLTSAVTAALVGHVPNVITRSAGTVTLRGFDEPWDLVAVEDGRVEVAAGTPFVGRHAEQRRLLQVIEGLLDGAGAIAFVSGVAGAGKSRLAEEAVAEARRRGVRTLATACRDRSTPVPLEPVLDLMRRAVAGVDDEAVRAILGEEAGDLARFVPELRRRLPDLPAAVQLPADQQQRYLFGAVAAVLARAAADGPLLLVVDDLQWADGETLALIEHLREVTAAHPVALLLTYREEAVRHDPRIAATIGRLVSAHRAVHVHLGPMTAADVEDLIRRIIGPDVDAGTVTALADRSGGNAFFVVELCRSLAGRDDAAGAAAGLPDTIRLAIQARLTELSEAAVRVARVVAVAGGSTTLAVLRTVTRMSEDALIDAIDEASEHDVLGVATDDGPTRVIVTHDLVRETIDAQLTALRRQHLHARLADALLAGDGCSPDDRAGEVAAHLLAAGELADRARTVPVLLTAGHRALDTASYGHAEERFGHVLGLVANGTPSDEQAEALTGLGYAVRSLHGWEAALGHWEHAIAVREQLGQRDAIGDLSRDIARQLIWAVRFPQSVDVVERGLAATEDEPGASRAYLLGVRGVLAGLMGLREVARDSFVAAEALCATPGGAEARGHVLCLEAFADVLAGDWRSAADAGRTAARLLADQGALWELAELLGWEDFALLMCGRRAEADTVAIEATRVWTRVGSSNGELLSGRNGIVRAVLDGDLEHAARLAIEDEERCERFGLPWTAHSLSWQALVAFHLGRWDEALTLSQRAEAVDVPGVLGHVWLVPRLLVYGHRRQPDLLRTALADPALPDLARAGSGGGAALAQVAAVEPLAAAGLIAEGARRWPRLRELADRGDLLTAWQFRQVATLAGIGAACAEDWSATTALFEHAIQQAEEQRWPLERADAERWYAWALERRGDRADRRRAEALRATAGAAFDALGMPRHRDLVRRASLTATA